MKTNSSDRSKWALVAVCAVLMSGMSGTVQAQSKQRVTYAGNILDENDNKIGKVILTFKGEKLEGYQVTGSGRTVTLSGFAFNNVKYDIHNAVVLLGQVQGFGAAPANWKGKVDFAIHEHNKTGKDLLPPIRGIGRIESRDERVVNGVIKLDGSLGGKEIHFRARKTEVR